MLGFSRSNSAWAADPGKSIHFLGTTKVTEGVWDTVRSPSFLLGTVTVRLSTTLQCSHTQKRPLGGGCRGKSHPHLPFPNQTIWLKFSYSPERKTKAKSFLMLQAPNFSFTLLHGHTGRILCWLSPSPSHSSHETLWNLTLTHNTPLKSTSDLLSAECETLLTPIGLETALSHLKTLYSALNIFLLSCLPSNPSSSVRAWYQSKGKLNDP